MVKDISIKLALFIGGILLGFLLQGLKNTKNTMVLEDSIVSGSELWTPAFDDPASRGLTEEKPAREESLSRALEPAQILNAHPELKISSLEIPGYQSNSLKGSTKK